MNSIDFLNIELVRIFTKFQNAIIKYEFKSSRNTHLIEVTPLDIYENEKFINEEINLMDSFNEKYPEENILFVSEESINRVSNPLIIFKNTKLEFCFKNNEIVTEPYFNDFNQHFSFGESNYCLAA